MVIRFCKSKTDAYCVPMHRELQAWLSVGFCNRPLEGGNYLVPELQERTSQDVATKFSRIARKHGIENAQLHRFRHTVNTRLIEAGATKEEAMRLLNHRTKSANDIYDHAEGEAMGHLLAKLEY